MYSKSMHDKWAELFMSTCPESPTCAYCQHYADIIRKPQVFTDLEKMDLFVACMKKISELSRRLEKVD